MSRRGLRNHLNLTLPICGDSQLPVGSEGITPTPLAGSLSDHHTTYKVTVTCASPTGEANLSLNTEEVNLRESDSEVDVEDTNATSITNHSDSVHHSISCTTIAAAGAVNGGDAVCKRRQCLELIPTDFIWLGDLGHGNGSLVSKTKHQPTGLLMAMKTFELDIPASVRAQILRDLQVLVECSCPYVVDYYGSFHIDGNIVLCSEYLDIGGLDVLLPRVGRLPEPVIAEVAKAALQGLLYLSQQPHVIFKNVKPSNILINKKGIVKLCDFNASAHLWMSLANAHIELRTYISPERLAGEPVIAQSDVWSFGITLAELAIGRYPIPAIDPVDFIRAFAPDQESNMVEHWKATFSGESLPILDFSDASPMGIFELIVCIVGDPAPRLPAYCFSNTFLALVHACLHKEPTDRLTFEILHSRILPPLLAYHESCLSEHKSLPRPLKSDLDTTVSPLLAHYLNGVFKT